MGDWKFFIARVTVRLRVRVRVRIRDECCVTYNKYQQLCALTGQSEYPACSAVSPPPSSPCWWLRGTSKPTYFMISHLPFGSFHQICFSTAPGSAFLKMVPDSHSFWWPINKYRLPPSFLPEAFTKSPSTRSFFHFLLASLLSAVPFKTSITKEPFGWSPGFTNNWTHDSRQIA